MTEYLQRFSIIWNQKGKNPSETNFPGMPRNGSRKLRALCLGPASPGMVLSIDTFVVYIYIYMYMYMCMHICYSEICIWCFPWKFERSDHIQKNMIFHLEIKKSSGNLCPFTYQSPSASIYTLEQHPLVLSISVGPGKVTRTNFTNHPSDSSQMDPQFKVI